MLTGLIAYLSYWGIENVKNVNVRQSYKINVAHGIRKIVRSRWLILYDSYNELLTWISLESLKKERMIETETRSCQLKKQWNVMSNWILYNLIKSYFKTRKMIASYHLLCKGDHCISHHFVLVGEYPRMLILEHNSNRSST